MSTRMEQAKHPVSALLAGPYGHPFHPILVTIPIGAWAASLIFDVASHVVDGSAFLAQGAAWLIAIGVLGAAVAASVGLLDLLAIPSGTRAFRVGLIHMALNVAVTVAYVVDFLWRRAIDSALTAVVTGPLVLSVISFAALGVSGYLGGMLSYRYGVRVARESAQAEGFRLVKGSEQED